MQLFWNVRLIQKRLNCHQHCNKDTFLWKYLDGMRYWSKIFVFAKTVAKIYAKHEEMSAAAENFFFFARWRFVVNHYDDVTANNYNVVIVTYFAERPVYPPAGHPAQLPQDWPLHVQKQLSSQLTGTILNTKTFITKKNKAHIFVSVLLLNFEWKEKEIF